MEVNNNLLDTEEELMEEDLDEEDLDEDEYDFNDEEDDSDEEDVAPDEEDADHDIDEDVDEDADEDDVDGVDEETPAAEEGTEGVVQEPGAADTNDPTREKMQKLLGALGYTGTFEEAMAAYEADKGNHSQGTPATVDYNEMARNDLRDINAAFGLDYADFSSFDDLKRFAELRTTGATALEAFRATQRQFQAQDKATEASSAIPAKPSKDHLKALPHSGAGESGKGGPSQEEIRALREVYPELSKKELGKVLDRVKRRRH